MREELDFKWKVEVRSCKEVVMKGILLREKKRERGKKGGMGWKKKKIKETPRKGEKEKKSLASAVRECLPREKPTGEIVITRMKTKMECHGYGVAMFWNILLTVREMGRRKNQMINLCFGKMFDTFLRVCWDFSLK